MVLKIAVLSGRVFPDVLMHTSCMDMHVNVDSLTNDLPKPLPRHPSAPASLGCPSCAILLTARAQCQGLDYQHRCTVRAGGGRYEKTIGRVNSLRKKLLEVGKGHAARAAKAGSKYDCMLCRCACGGGLFLGSSLSEERARVAGTGSCSEPIVASCFCSR